MRLPDIFVTMYGRNGSKFVMFISNLWYPQNWKGQILAHENYPVTAGVGYPWQLCSQTFLAFCYYRLTKPSPFHNTTKDGVFGGRIVINILLMYNQILYDNKQPSAMLWSSSQMWSWLHPYSVGFILRKCAPTVGFIPKYSWPHHTWFSRANISTALAN